MQVGEYLLDGFRQLQGKHDIIGDVRGRGLMTGVELVRDRTTKEPAKEETVQASCPYGSVVVACNAHDVEESLCACGHPACDACTTPGRPGKGASRAWCSASGLTASSQG